MEKKEKRGSFTGSLGFVLAAAGSAVGLGCQNKHRHSPFKFILRKIISLSTPGSNLKINTKG